MPTPGTVGAAATMVRANGAHAATVSACPIRHMSKNRRSNAPPGQSGAVFPRTLLNSASVISSVFSAAPGASSSLAMLIHPEPWSDRKSATFREGYFRMVSRMKSSRTFGSPMFSSPASRRSSEESASSAFDFPRR